jgi:FlaA1/EpsC-like NDP-sugar epimerase
LTAQFDGLLNRRPVAPDTAPIRRQIEEACVLITGAGGSIGGELSRQTAGFGPRLLLLLGHGENSLFSLEHRLRAAYPDLRFRTILADVRDRTLLEKVFQDYRPTLVFHAAAHKHVPMVEANVAEGVLNNVLGTHHLIELCNRFETGRMVHISTDKAVEPTSAMGMSKRVAELLILDAARGAPSRFASVRFGNVLGSRGSVVPLFQEQIGWGGPITITSKMITRYFMSVPEAVSLVMRAGVFTGHSPLFALNMGTPIRIYDLACDLIRLNGLRPEIDIEIREIGLRPGEKLYEDLNWDYEIKSPIDDGAFFSIAVAPELARQMIEIACAKLDDLFNAARSRDDARTRQLLREIVFFTPERPTNTP